MDEAERRARVREQLSIIGARWALALVVAGLVAFVALVVKAASLADQAIEAGPQLNASDRVNAEEQDNRLREQGHRLRDAVEAFRTEHGRNPVSLAEVGVAPANMSTEFGEWRLNPGDPAGYELSLGDHARNGFVLSWRQGAQEWHMDVSR